MTAAIRLEQIEALLPSYSRAGVANESLLSVCLLALSRVVQRFASGIAERNHVVEVVDSSAVSWTCLASIPRYCQQRTSGRLLVVEKVINVKAIATIPPLGTQLQLAFFPVHLIIHYTEIALLHFILNTVLEYLIFDKQAGLVFNLVFVNNRQSEFEEGEVAEIEGLGWNSSELIGALLPQLALAFPVAVGSLHVALVQALLISCSASPVAIGFQVVAVGGAPRCISCGIVSLAVRKTVLIKVMLQTLLVAGAHLLQAI